MSKAKKSRRRRTGGRPLETHIKTVAPPKTEPLAENSPTTQTDKWATFKNLAKILRGADFVSIISCVFVAFTADNMLAIYLAAIIACGLGCAWAWLENGLSKNKRIAWSAVASVFAVILWIGAVYNKNENEKSKSQQDTAYQAELPELKSLDHAIGDQDEIMLRVMFDYSCMVELNVARFAVSERPDDDSLKNTQADLIQRCPPNFTEKQDRQRVVPLVNQKGEIEYSQVRGQFGLAYETKKFWAYRLVLQQYGHSAGMRDDVKAAVANMVNILDRNEMLIFGVINQRYERDPETIFGENNPQSPYFQGTYYEFYSRMFPIRPYAQKISETLRPYIQGKKPL